MTKRSNKIAVFCHCMLNVHSLEKNLAEYPGFEEDIVKKAMERGVGFVQLRCPEIRRHGIERLPMPKDNYDKPMIRESYRKQAKEEVLQLKEFVKNGARATTYSHTSDTDSERRPTTESSISYSEVYWRMGP